MRAPLRVERRFVPLTFAEAEERSRRFRSLMLRGAIRVAQEVARTTPTSPPGPVPESR